MSNWMPEGFSRTRKGPAFTSLVESVTQLPPSAKQAMFAAAQRGPIAQRTWNGCAFNAGGAVIGESVSSSSSAAAAFGMNPTMVTAWIRFWDSYQSDTPTEDLVEAINEVGLFSTPPTIDDEFVGKTFVKVIHESEQEKFDKMVADLDLNEAVSEEDAQFKTGVSVAADLLFA